MAKKRGHSAGTNDSANDLQALLGPTPGPLPLTPMAPFSLPLLEDRRQFHPEGPVRPPRSFDHYSTVKIHEPKNRSAAKRTRTYSPSSDLWDNPRKSTRNRRAASQEIGFSAPDRVAICIRRKRRREVLHALRKTGRGGRVRRRLNHYSKIRC